MFTFRISNFGAILIAFSFDKRLRIILVRVHERFVYFSITNKNIDQIRRVKIGLAKEWNFHRLIS